jgi:GT2 family glycosyltransferase
MTSRVPKLAIIIPLYEYTGIESVIDSITRNNYPNCQIIVIDNSQAAEYKEKYASKLAAHPAIRYYSQSANLGVTGGRNKGIQHLDPDCEFVLFLDHDVLIREDCLENLVRDFTTLEQEGPIGILTGKVLYNERHDQIWAAGTDINLYSGKIMFYCGKDEGQFETYRQVGVAPSIIFTRYSLVNKLGGFDDLFFANYDDTEFSYRYKKKGFPTFYSPHVVGFHDIPFQSQNAHRLLNRGYFIARNRILFMRRHSKCYPVFLCFIPLWCAYYFRVYLANKRVKDFKEYLKGTLHGLFLRM